MIAAATMVPDIIAARDELNDESVVVAIPVNTKETPECGSKVNPKNFVTVGSAFVNFPPMKAPPIFPTALDNMYTTVNIPAPAISL